MHDLDRTLQEFEMGAVDALEADAFELEFWNDGEGEWEYGVDVEIPVFDEVEEMELAASLLEIATDEEMDYFLGNLIKKASKAARGFIRSPTGRALGGVLKRVAKQALPAAGAAIGNALLPGVGGAVGSFAGDAAGKIFGLELEGMSPQDQEFEVARRVVRLAGEATRQAAQMPQAGNPVREAKDAVMLAAEFHAPGLLGAAIETAKDASQHFGRVATTAARGAGRVAAQASRGAQRAARATARDAQRNFAKAGAGGGGGASGRWVRRGDTIVILGV